MERRNGSLINRRFDIQKSIVLINNHHSVEQVLYVVVSRREVLAILELSNGKIR